MLPWRKHIANASFLFDVVAGRSGPDMCCFTTSVSLSVVRCPSCDNISKTEQDRPKVTVELYIEVGTAGSVVAFRSSADSLWGGPTALYSGKRDC